MKFFTLLIKIISFIPAKVTDEGKLKEEQVDKLAMESFNI